MNGAVDATTSYTSWGLPLARDKVIRANNMISGYITAELCAICVLDVGVHLTVKPQVSLLVCALFSTCLVDLSVWNFYVDLHFGIFANVTVRDCVRDLPADICLFVRLCHECFLFCRITSQVHCYM